jgi:hypothetical protein
MIYGTRRVRASRINESSIRCGRASIPRRKCASSTAAAILRNRQSASFIRTPSSPCAGPGFSSRTVSARTRLRFFRVDRVQSAVGLAAVITSEARDLLLGHERMMSATTERLVIRYSPRIARWIAEREEGEAEPDGSFVVSHPLADDAWAVRHVLQYGPEALVLEPERLRQRVVATLTQMASVVG